MRFVLDNVDNDDMEATAPQTDRSRDYGDGSPEDLANLGRSEELDNADGDIADEGPGRRG